MTVYNPARQRVEQGQSVVGTWVFTRDVGVVEAVAQSGLDFIAVDMEHTALTWETVEDHIRVANASGISVFVRIAPATPESIGRALDLGAHGVCIPHLSAHLARELAPAFRFPPAGTRGTCTGTKAASGGWASFSEYVHAADDGSWFIGLVEDRQGIEDLQALLDDGLVDVILPGRADLSSYYGAPGAMEEADVEEAVELIVSKTAQSSQVHAGAYVVGPEHMAPSLRCGAQVIFCSIDMKMIREQFSTLARRLRAGAAVPAGE